MAKNKNTPAAPAAPVAAAQVPAVISIEALRTAALAELNPIAAGIAALQQKYQDVVYDVRASAGMEEAKAARLDLRNVRYPVPHIVKEKRAQLRQVGNDIDAKADEIIAAILALEEPIDAQIKVEETRKAEEKRQREEAEARRKQIHLDNIAEIRAKGENALTLASAALQARIEGLELVETGADVFEEFSTQASLAKGEVLASLRTLYALAVQREQDQAELAELRAQQAVNRARATSSTFAPADDDVKPRADTPSNPTIEQDARRESVQEPAPFAPATPSLVRKPQPTLLAPQMKGLAAGTVTRMMPRVAAQAPAPAPVTTAAPGARPSDAEIIEAVAMYFMVDEDVARGWLLSMQLQGVTV
jgi:hypothetical protein